MLVAAAVELLAGAGEAVVCWTSAEGDATRAAASSPRSRLQAEVLALVEAGLPPGRHERPAMLPGADVSIYAGELPDGGQLVLAAAIPTHRGNGVHLSLRTLHDIGVAGHAHLARRATALRATCTTTSSRRSTRWAWACSARTCWTASPRTRRSMPQRPN